MIICKMFGFTAASGEIIKRKIEKHGGKATMFVEGLNFSEFSHVIVPSRITREALASLLKLDLSSPSLKIVIEDWACDMFSKQKLLSDCNYSWKAPLPPVLKRKLAASFSPPSKLKPELLAESGRNFNFHLTKELEKLKNYYEILGDRGRTITYSNTLRTLRLLPFKVESMDQIKNIEGLGPKTLNKVREILDHGSLQRLETFRQNERIATMDFLKQIHGIGNEMAYSLYKQGVRTIQSLQLYANQHPESFTETQRTSIDLFTDLQQKIPREEVKEISDIIREKVKSLDPEAEFEVCGSYRRGRELCGDVDIVIATSVRDLLIELVQKTGVFTHTFSLSSHKFMGLGKAREVYRRIDVYVCSPREFWFAVLYFTGSANYNRMLRMAAMKKGLHLSNTDMHEVANGKAPVAPKCEEDIIEFLGFPRISLQERDV